MFKKLLSNLAFNPSLIGQVSFYAKRMHQESAVRRTGVIMLALALLVQTFAVISPPEPTLANSNNDLIVGGIKSASAAAQVCNNDTRNFKKILAYYDISCSDIANATTKEIKSTDFNKKLYSMGYVSQGSTIERTGKPTGETPVSIPGVGKLYLRHLWSFDSGPYSTYTALQIVKGNTTYFILYNCGNLVFIGLPVPPTPAFTINKSVRLKGQTNFVQDVTAKAEEQVEFAIDVKNTGNVDLKRVEIRDALPAGLKAVNGSLAVDGKKVSALLAGFNSGTLAKGQTVRVTFAATVDKNVSACGTNRLKNVVTVKPDDLAPKNDDATVQVCKPKEVPTEQPIPETCPYNNTLPKDSPECKPCEESQTRSDLTACIENRKTVRNVTQNIADANGTMAKANDVVEYTLLVTNKGKVKIEKFVFEENISDVLDYANVVNLYGGTLDEFGNVTWPAIDIDAGQTVQKQIMVKIKDPVPQTPVSASDGGRFDLQMVNTYGNTTVVKLPETVIKTVEIKTSTLPNTGPGESLLGAIALTVFVSYFFARSRLIAKELDVVRNDFATSGGY